VGERPFTNILFRGGEAKTLADTGASRSLLRRDVFLDICKQLSRIPLLKAATPLLSVVGEELTVLGRAQMEMANGSVWPWTIVEGIQHEAILGADIMDEGNAILNFPSRVLTLGGCSYPLYSEPGVECTEFRDPIEDVLRRYSDIFYKKGTPLKECKLSPLVIETGNSPPVHQRPYRTPLARRKIVEEEIKEMLQLGVIRPSASPWAAPLLLVPKKDQTWRACVDYRKTNQVIKMDRHPLPLIQDIFDQLHGATIFTTVDLKSGYWQLPVDENSIEKTAFVCHMGQYEFLREPMGISSAPQVFQREMQKALAGLVGTCVLVYLDDLVIYSKGGVEDHAKDIESVFRKIREYGLTLKREKCTFGKSEVELLGYVISRDGIKANPDKVKAITSLPAPKSVKQVRRLLGMAGYYRQTVKDYARMVEPLVALTRKYAQFGWGPKQQQAFEKVKDALVSNEVMAYPQTDKPYKLYTDACDYAVGGILVQEDDKGIDRVVHYLSHQLSSTQQRWAPIEKEAYAVVYALKKLRAYLCGADFTVYTDHKPLKSLFTEQMNNTKIQRWAILLAEYGAKVEYIKGARNIRADMLSRIGPADSICVIDTDDWVDADFPEGMESSRIPLEEDDLTEDSVSREQSLVYADQMLEANEEGSEYEVHNGLLYSIKKPNQYDAEYPRIVLPPCFRKQVIERAHRDVGHMGHMKTMKRVQEAYVWKGMKAEIQKRVRLCPLCAVHIRRREHVPMGEMPIASYPSQIVSADLIGPLAETDKGSKYVLTILDHFTGWAEAYPLPNKRSETVTDKFVNDFFPRVGEPEILITDNGLEFNEREWLAYLREIGVEHRTTTPVHPQSNGRIERFNRTLKEMLRKLINGKRLDWEKKLPMALKAYRISVSTVTGFSPFHLWHARRPRVPLTRMLQPDQEYGSGFRSRLADMSDVYKQAKLLTEDSRKYNRERLARKANAGEIEVGDTVIVAANEPLTLTAKWDHQFEVIRRVKTTFWLRNQVTGKVIKVHREKIRLVDPNLPWDDVATRPRRQIIHRVAPPVHREPPLERVAPQPTSQPKAATPTPPGGVDPLLTSEGEEPSALVTAQEPMDAEAPIHDTRLARRKRGMGINAPEESTSKRQRIECIEFVTRWFHRSTSL